MTKLEEVAKAMRTYGIRLWGSTSTWAIIKGDWDHPISGPLDHLEAIRQCDALNARAVVETLREPREEMFSLLPYGWSKLDDYDATRIWADICDAILNETPEGKD